MRLRSRPWPTLFDPRPAFGPNPNGQLEVNRSTHLKGSSFGFGPERKHDVFYNSLVKKPKIGNMKCLTSAVGLGKFLEGVLLPPFLFMVSFGACCLDVRTLTSCQLMGYPNQTTNSYSLLAGLRRFRRRVSKEVAGTVLYAASSECSFTTGFCGALRCGRLDGWTAGDRLGMTHPGRPWD